MGFPAGIEPRFGFEFTDNIVFENNLSDVDHPEEGFHSDAWGNEMIFSPSLDLSFGDHLSAFALVDFSWTHYGDDHDDETETDVGTAIVCMTLPRFLVSVGFQPVTAGRGLIDDESEPGISMDLTLSDRLELNVSGALLDDSSTLISGNIGYTPGLFEKVDVFAACYKAGDDAFLRYLYYYEEQSFLGTPFLINFPHSSGYLTYVGAGADLFFLGNYLQFTLIFQHGEITFDSEEYTFLTETRTFERTLDIASFIADVDVSRNLSEAWSISGFIRAQSGGDGSGSFDGYVTPVPLTYRTLVFGHEQFFGDFDHDDLISNTVTYTGLIAPGLGITFAPGENFFIKSFVTGFYPYQQPDGASFYGWEWDVNLVWDVTSRIDVHAQAGYFQHGDVVENLQGEGPPPASCIVTGITVSF